MFTLEKRFRFEAAHKLPKHDGKCRRLHGHSWVGTVIIRGDQLEKTGPKSGMLMDFADLSEALKEIIENQLDHWYLNEMLPLENPTSEEIARWLYYELTPKVRGLYAVKIEETCTSSCTYSRVQLMED